MSNTIGIIDDQKMFSEGFSLLIAQNSNLKVILEAHSLQDSILKMAGLSTLPNIIFIAIQILEHNGAEIAASITKHYPSVKLIAISYFHKPVKVEAMFANGCIAFFGKNIEHSLLYSGIQDIINGNFHNKSECFTDKKSFYNSPSYGRIKLIGLNEAEIVLLKLLCTNMTYNKIGFKIKMTRDMVDYYRKHIYLKFDVNNKPDLIFMAQELGYID